MVISITPVRIDFGGGGTDIEPYDKEHGGVVVNATINKYARTIIDPRLDDKVQIISNDLKKIITKDSISDLRYDTFLDLAIACIKRFNSDYNFNSGWDFYLRCQAPTKSGLGASASISTSLIGGLNQLIGNKLSKHEIAELGYLVETRDLQNAGGRQDQYAAVYGGFNQIEFNGKDNVNVIKFPIKKSFIDYLENNLVLFYTGIPHTSGNLVGRQVDSYEKILEPLHKVKEIAYRIIDSLKSDNYQGFAQGLTDDWAFKTWLNPYITTDSMRGFHKAVSKRGVIGGRVCGAGGGGCMIWACKERTKDKVTDFLKNQDGKVIPFNFEPVGIEEEGLKIE